jgi:aryl-alcohol dehydrogenase-like predicted oxidoreductase
MKYRLLGKSGLRVSEAALGAMTFGDSWGWGSPKAEAQKVYVTYREAGGNFMTQRTSTPTVRHRSVPVIPIIGARKLSQLQDNLASLDLVLSAQQLKSLDKASRIELGFPQSIYERETVRAVRYGGVWDRLVL